MNPDGYTVVTTSLDRVISFDDTSGRLRCQPGLTFEQIIATFLPLGWFPSVSPGTQFVTVGGAVAFDVHGKNHHADGSFCRYVHALTLLLPSGEVLTCSRTHLADLFWATVGGMGLTGIITEVELSLRPVESAYIATMTLKARSLEEVFQMFETHDKDYRYSVAWIDSLASGKALGRGLLSFGNHAGRGELSQGQTPWPAADRSPRPVNVPVDLPSGTLNRLSIGIFNSLYFHHHIRARRQQLLNWRPFFYPLDSFGNWNRLYGKRGFTQYQFVVPFETAAVTISEILALSSRKGLGSFLTVLKRFGVQEGWLSFPQPGYTLAMDLPLRPGLFEVLDVMDKLVARNGGRVYLAKDARLSPAVFREMYPELPRWLAVKRSIDPANRFSSALSKRLQIA